MDFQGFQHSVPLLLTLVMAIGLGALSFYSYSKQKNLSRTSRILLSTLRTTVFLVLLLLAFNPYFFSATQVDKKPRIMVLADNSYSTVIQKGAYSGEETYRDILADLDFQGLSGSEFDYFSFDNSTRKIPNLDSLRFSGSETNLLSAIDQITELEEDYEAAILISDGIITYGRNPVILAANLSIPVYTIALGDTSTVRDVKVNNVVTNSTGYTESQQLVEVEVAQKGYLGESVTVELKDAKGIVLADTLVKFVHEEEVRTLELRIPLHNEGLQQFSVLITELRNEWTYENNRTNFSIDVLDSKTKVLHFAFEIHPDVKMLRSILSADPNIELTTKTWLGANRFVEQEELDDEYDLIVFHGLPGSNSQLIKQFSDVPTILLELPKSIRSTSSYPDLALVNNFGGQLFELNISPEIEKNAHPIMELPEVSFDLLAPVLSSLRINVEQPDAQILFQSVFQNVETRNPVIAVLERGGVRRLHVSAWNWYRMYQSNSDVEREFITVLFTNMVNWTSNDPDDRRLKLSPSKSSFNISEQVVINGSLNNESGEPESSASIEITLTDSEDLEKVYGMDNLGSGRYQLNVEALSSGVYSYQGIARKGDRVIDEEAGEFIVENSNTELVNTVRDDALLASLANETGGKNFGFENISSFWSTLNNDGVLSVKSELVESYHFPVRSFWWFALILVLLGAEWVIRKNYSLP